MICSCASHCANRCEPGHCPPGTPPCACWCHAKTVKVQKDGRIPAWIYETEGPPDPEGRLRQIVNEDREE